MKRTLWDGVHDVLRQASDQMPCQIFGAAAVIYRLDCVGMNSGRGVLRGWSWNGVARAGVLRANL